MKEIDVVIREIKDQTNIACMNDPESYMPVVAKSVIAFLESLKANA